MNRHLKTRLTESQILDIFVAVTDAVAHMHSLSILHRDLKIENILQSGPKSFKLCDFGSATRLKQNYKPSNLDEIKALEADLNKHTTIQYRAPEMVDPYQCRIIDEKADIWALGVLLYKLCYYTTPFEQNGALAILNVQYTIPNYPLYSSSLNTLICGFPLLFRCYLILIIASMLREQSSQRPSAVEILKRVHQMRGTIHEFKVSIKISSFLLLTQLATTFKTRQTTITYANQDGKTASKPKQESFEALSQAGSYTTQTKSFPFSF